MGISYGLFTDNYTLPYVLISTCAHSGWYIHHVWIPRADVGLRVHYASSIGSGIGNIVRACV